jgi:hypothetical protein
VYSSSNLLGTSLKRAIIIVMVALFGYCVFRPSFALPVSALALLQNGGSGRGCGPVLAITAIGENLLRLSGRKWPRFAVTARPARLGITAENGNFAG